MTLVTTREGESGLYKRYVLTSDFSRSNNIALFTIRSKTQIRTAKHTHLRRKAQNRLIAHHCPKQANTSPQNHH